MLLMRQLNLTILNADLRSEFSVGIILQTELDVFPGLDVSQQQSVNRAIQDTADVLLDNFGKFLIVRHLKGEFFPVGVPCMVDHTLLKLEWEFFIQSMTYPLVSGTLNAGELTIFPHCNVIVRNILENAVLSLLNGPYAVFRVDSFIEGADVTTLDTYARQGEGERWVRNWNTTEMSRDAQNALPSVFTIPLPDITVQTDAGEAAPISGEDPIDAITRRLQEIEAGEIAMNEGTAEVDTPPIDAITRRLQEIEAREIAMEVDTPPIVEVSTDWD